MITRENQETFNVPEQPTDLLFPATENQDYKVVEFANKPMPICMICKSEWNSANNLEAFEIHMWAFHGLQFRLTKDGTQYQLPEKPVIVEVKPEPVVYPNGSDSPRFGYME